MNTVIQIFRHDAFRKRMAKDDRRKPINKALFEVFSVYFAKMNEKQSMRLIERKDEFIDKFIILNNDNKFQYAISSGTGQKESVNRRYNEIRRIIEETLEENI